RVDVAGAVLRCQGSRGHQERPRPLHGVRASAAVTATEGGGIFKSEWWQVWEGTHFPIIDLVIASLDSAFTEKQENDPSALTVWGVFKHPDTGKTRVILIDAWRKHLQMHGSATPRLDHEILQLGDDARVRRYKDRLWAKRVGKAWGLVEWTVHTMRKWQASVLLIEGKASGQAGS